MNAYLHETTMNRRRALFAFAAALCTSVAAASCSKPEPPVLTPKEATVTRLDLAGADLRVTMEAFNPNRVALSAQRVVGRVVLDGKHDLGTVTIDRPTTLPAGARTLIDVPLAVKWSNAATFASLASARRAMPYTIDGTVTVGGERLNIDVPFSLRGVITQEQIVQATMSSLQNIPGLPPGLLPPPAATAPAAK